MPGFATGETTKSYATAAPKALGVTFEELDIRPAARQMLADLDHPFAEGEPVYDVTFENVQAGLRTDYLFRLANHHGGIVLGTGDLSELALGWCTYGVGDQMSHYNVNAGVPKTLIQHLIRWVIGVGEFDEEADEVLREILEQEITPELIPDRGGREAAGTEDSSGPTSCRTSPLYHVLRTATGPSKIAFLAWHAWRDAARGVAAGLPRRPATRVRPGAIRRWLEVFVKRFFASQFKRSAMPNGPKVSAGGSLSRAATGGCRPTPAGRMAELDGTSRRMPRLVRPPVLGRRHLRWWYVVARRASRARPPGRSRAGDVVVLADAHRLAMMPPARGDDVPADAGRGRPAAGRSRRRRQASRRGGDHVVDPGGR